MKNKIFAINERDNSEIVVQERTKQGIVKISRFIKKVKGKFENKWYLLKKGGRPHHRQMSYSWPGAPRTSRPTRFHQQG